MNLSASSAQVNKVASRLRGTEPESLILSPVAASFQITPSAIQFQPNWSEADAGNSHLDGGIRGAADLIDSMHQLRARFYRGRLEWAVDVRLDREVDEFDSYRPTYILAVTASRQVQIPRQSAP